VVIQEAVNQAQLLEEGLEEKEEENRLLRQRMAGLQEKVQDLLSSLAVDWEERCSGSRVASHRDADVEFSP
jgi:hypothetical protein